METENKEIKVAQERAQVAEIFVQSLLLKCRESKDFKNVSESAQKALQKRFKDLKREKGIVCLVRREGELLNIKKM